MSADEHDEETGVVGKIVGALKGLGGASDVDEKGPVRLTQARLDEFVDTLKQLGNSSGNKKLRELLGWQENFYWRAQARLIEDQRIAPGRGIGGSVHLIEPQEETNTAGTQEDESRDVPAESSLYAPLRKNIESKWINRLAFDEVKVDETHSLGRKDTGGRFTRPDITAVGIRRYLYVSKRLEAVTFEIKNRDNVGIMGVLEAIAHREAANRSYVIYVAPSNDLASEEGERMLEVGRKYGIGIIFAENPDNVDEWEILLEAARHEPDPYRLDRFLGDTLSETTKEWLMKIK
jgi:hypothetical protein